MGHRHCGCCVHGVAMVLPLLFLPPRALWARPVAVTWSRGLGLMYRHVVNFYIQFIQLRINKCTKSTHHCSIARDWITCRPQKEMVPLVIVHGQYKEIDQACLNCLGRLRNCTFRQLFSNKSLIMKGDDCETTTSSISARKYGRKVQFLCTF
jgi:hypothetical protein